MTEASIRIGRNVRYVAITEQDGSVCEIYYTQAALDRVDGPAVSLVRADGSTRKQYWRGGKLHRDDGPAWIDAKPMGLSSYEAYYVHGEMHRENGPAATVVDQDGGVDELFFRRGERVR